MEENEKTVTVTATPNGPFIIEGDFKFVDREGNTRMQNGKTAFCRCGHSHNQPFCDGTHLKVHFDDTAKG